MHHIVAGGTLGGDWLFVGADAFNLLHKESEAAFEAYTAIRQRRANQSCSNARADVVALALPLLASAARRSPSTAQVWVKARAARCDVDETGGGLLPVHAGSLPREKGREYLQAHPCLRHHPRVQRRTHERAHTKKSSFCIGFIP